MATKAELLALIEEIRKENAELSGRANRHSFDLAIRDWAVQDLYRDKPADYTAQWTDDQGEYTRRLYLHRAATYSGGYVVEVEARADGAPMNYGQYSYGGPHNERIEVFGFDDRWLQIKNRIAQGYASTDQYAEFSAWEKLGIARDRLVSEQIEKAKG